MTTKKEVKAVQAAPKTDKVVFEGTVAGRKFLFLANKQTLEQVAEVPAGKSAEEIALQNSAELVARAKANHEAVKALFRAWISAKKAEKAASPEAVAAKAEKDAAKARAKADRLADRQIERAEKAKSKAAEKAAKLEAKAEALRKQAAETQQKA